MLLLPTQRAVKKTQGVESPDKQPRVMLFVVAVAYLSCALRDKRERERKSLELLYMIQKCNLPSAHH